MAQIHLRSSAVAILPILARRQSMAPDRVCPLPRRILRALTRRRPRLEAIRLLILPLKGRTRFQLLEQSMYPTRNHLPLRSMERAPIGSFRALVRRSSILVLRPMTDALVPSRFPAQSLGQTD